MTCLQPLHKGNRRFSLRFPLVPAAGLCFLLLAGLLPAARAGAASITSLIAGGNKAYAAGDYKKALGLYDKAAKKGTRPVISYDRGNALYRLGHFEEARQAYNKAVDDLKNDKLVSRGYYNMGNAAYRQGEARQKQQPDKALTLFNESAAAYREALHRDPSLAGAGANLELADRKIKELKALKRKLQKEQQDKTGQNKRQAKGQKDKTLKDLADRQKQLAKQTDKLQNDKQDNAEQKEKAADSLAARQKKLRRQTEKKAQAGKSKQTRKDLQDATALQKKAEEKLHRNQLAQAAKLQEKAAKKLQKAAAAEGQNEKKQAANRQQQNKATGKQTKKKKQANKQGQDIQTANEDQNRQATAAPQLDPRKILNQERIRRQQQRQRMTAADSLRVDKDW